MINKMVLKYIMLVWQYMDATYLGRWIGPSEWPPQSLGLSSIDLFFWGHLKSKV